MATTPSPRTTPTPSPTGAQPASPTTRPPRTSALQRENESATTLARQGYDIEQTPTVPGAKNPDYRIEGQVFDNYAPTSDNARNITDTIERKVVNGQTDRVVLNLTDNPVDLDAMRAQLRDWPIEGLNEVIVIDKQGNVLPFYP